MFLRLQTYFRVCLFFYARKGDLDAQSTGPAGHERHKETENKNENNQEDEMLSKTNRVISLAMSAALMLTNVIAPISAYAEEAVESSGEETYVSAEPETIPEPETEAKEYVITLPWYEDIVYMVDEGRVFHPENDPPENKDIYLKYKPEEKVEFAFTPANGVSVTELHLRDDKKEENYFETDEYGKISFLMPEKDLFFALAYEKVIPPETEEETKPESVMDELQ